MKAKKYMIRVTVDIPMWAYDENEAENNARHCVRLCHTACSVVDSILVPPIPSDMTTKTVEDEKRSHVSDRPEISSVDTFLGVVPHADKHIY